MLVWLVTGAVAGGVLVFVVYKLIRNPIKKRDARINELEQLLNRLNQDREDMRAEVRRSISANTAEYVLQLSDLNRTIKRQQRAFHLLWEVVHPPYSQPAIEASKDVVTIESRRNNNGPARRKTRNTTEAR